MMEGEELRAFVQTHAHDRPQTKYAKMAGVSMSTWYRLRRELGIHGECDSRNYDYEKIVAKHWRTMHRNAIAAKYGVKKSAITRIVKRLGLTRTAEEQAAVDAETKRLMGRGLTKAHSLWQDPEWRKARGEARKVLYKKECRRDAYGLQRKTKLRVKRCPRKVVLARCFLVHRYGYIATTDPYIMWYDDNTTRNVKGGGENHQRRGEEYYTQKYHIKFKQAE